MPSRRSCSVGSGAAAGVLRVIPRLITQGQPDPDRRPPPGPSLCARISPPCCSSRWRAMARPRPRPPCCASARLSRLAEAIEDVRQELRRRCRRRSPAPRSRSRHRSTPRADLDAPALRRELDRVRQHVAEHLVQPLRVAVDRRQVGRHELRERRSACASAAGSTPLTTLSTQLRHERPAALDLELAGDDARDVEDVLDQLRLQLRVAADDVDGLADRVRARDRAAEQHLHPAEDRVQRRAQLVRERGQELVLEAARFFGGRQPRELGLLAARDHHADAGHPHRLAASYSTRPLPSTHRTCRPGATMRYSTSCGTPSVDRAVHRGAARARDRRDESRARSWRRCRRTCPAAGRGSARDCRTTATRCCVQDPSPTCPSRPRRARTAAAPRSAAPAPRCASARPRTRLARRSTPASWSSSALKRVRLVVIQHELADHAAEADERDERHRRDAFGLDGRQEAAQRRILRDVGDDDRLRVRAVGRPRGVAFDRLSVRLGQPAVGLEAHHAVGIEQQDRRARHGEAVARASSAVA